MRFFSTEIDGSGWSLVFWIFDQNRAGFQEVREPLGGGVRGVSGGSQGGPGGGVPGCSRKGGPQKVFRGVLGVPGPKNNDRRQNLGLRRSQSLPSRLPGGFTLPHRSVETLGRGPRSKPRAPMHMDSGALGSLGFRV